MVSIGRACAALTAGLLLMLLLIGSPVTVEAHAEMERAVPEPNTGMDTSPQAVELFFNEAIEPNVGSIAVLDSRSKPVTGEKAVTGSDRKSLLLSLPQLGEGVYTVSYQIISADGHPVNGSYIFVVGDPPEGVDASTFGPHNELGHEGHTASTQLTTGQFIIYAARIAYYAVMLLAAGLVLWSVMGGRQDALKEAVGRWEPVALRALLITALVFVFVHARDILTGFPSEDYSRLFLHTSVGRGWLALIVLTVASFPLLRLGKVVRVLWVAALLGLESWSGHAVVFKPAAATVLMDFIHLAASAVLAGGLALLLVLWIADRKEAGRFAARFSRAALISLSLLILTGVGMTLLFLPGWDYLFYTSWGTLLLVKTGLVCVVLIVGGVLHLRARRGDLPAYSLLRVDIGVMALIIAVAALFTYISPLPANAPVYYHKMGTDMHLTLRISPNKPGVNKFTLKVWLPDKAGVPKSTLLRLRSLDREEMGPIDVPLEVNKDDKDITSFEGFVKMDYKAEGPYIPFAGRWKAEIRVMDQEDNEKVEQYEFSNY
ncbi:copper resistance protein CopC/CopD [Paenibacillus oenotherae]|uniref:Copper resistance protein CopC/CopD n=2 Tax=Paenibacillus oenotherae TaxID=1435645 RepID=A0ABS7D3D5_9BACL|nr:copper resistance protein CopC/CopD [Paenibacillus oenotherae]